MFVCYPKHNKENKTIEKFTTTSSGTIEPSCPADVQFIDVQGHSSAIPYGQDVKSIIIPNGRIVQLNLDQVINEYTRDRQIVNISPVFTTTQTNLRPYSYYGNSDSRVLYPVNVNSRAIYDPNSDPPGQPNCSVPTFYAGSNFNRNSDCNSTNPKTPFKLNNAGVSVTTLGDFKSEDLTRLNIDLNSINSICVPNNYEVTIYKGNIGSSESIVLRSSQSNLSNLKTLFSPNGWGNVTSAFRITKDIVTTDPPPGEKCSTLKFFEGINYTGRMLDLVPGLENISEINSICIPKGREIRYRGYIWKTSQPDISHIFEIYTRHKLYYKDIVYRITFDPSSDPPGQPNCIVPTFYAGNYYNRNSDPNLNNPGTPFKLNNAGISVTTLGDFRVDSLNIDNDSINSICIPPGYKVTVYQDYISSNSIVFTSSQSNLSAIGWGNTISSFNIYKNFTPDPPGQPNCIVPTFYAGSNYNGNFDPNINGGSTPFKLNSKGVSVPTLGHFAVDNLNIDRNSINSICVPNGYTVTVYEDNSNSVVFTNNQSNLSAIGWGNKINSIKIYKNFTPDTPGQPTCTVPTFYAGPNFNANLDPNIQGAFSPFKLKKEGVSISQVFDNGITDLSSFDIENNAINSICIPNGYQVTVIDIDRDHESKVFTSSQSNLSSIGWGNNIDWIFICPPNQIMNKIEQYPYEVCINAPNTTRPNTIAPTTMAPTTMAPNTMAPNTIAPTTIAPNTMARSTMAPNTIAPTTMAPTTMAPNTIAPSTMAPSTMVPSTMAPSTMAPSTMAPSTTVPNTTTPITEQPILFITTQPNTTSPNNSQQPDYLLYGGIAAVILIILIIIYMSQ